MGNFADGHETKVYKILEEKDEKFLYTYDEEEKYEAEYYENSLINKRKRILQERRNALEGISEKNIDNIRKNNDRYRKNYAPARLEAAQLIRDTWDIRDREPLDEDGLYLIEGWEFDDEWNEERRWQDYIRREEIFLKKLKKEVILDMHGFDSEGIYYNRMSVSGEFVAEPTGNEYDRYFFDKEGMYCIVDEKTGKVEHTTSNVDPRGFDQNGFFHNPETGECNSIYDNFGYDIDGYDRHGFNRSGLNRLASRVNLEGFKVDGTCVSNNGLKHTKTGFTIDGINVYTGTYRDIFGRNQQSSRYLPSADKIVDKEKNLNAYGINPINGKNTYGVIDPTIRFAKYYFSEILEFGREPSELIESLSGAYRIPLDDMKLLADQKIFIALNGYPKLKEEIQQYFERGKKEIGKNYEMHKRVMEEHEKRRNSVKPKFQNKLESNSKNDGTGFDDDL